MKKLSLLLASIGAGLLLVGGTVAAYIVTAADTLGVRVSPGSIQTDTTERVTLSWGTNTTHHVGNLEPGVATEVGEVSLVGTKDNASFAYNGGFTVSIKNLTANAGLGDHDLVKNHLTLTVLKKGVGAADYDTEHPTVITASELVDGHTVMEQEFRAIAGESYKVKVTLTGVTTADDYYLPLLSQTAYATFNWGIYSGNVEDIDTKDMGTVYYSPAVALGENEELYAYIYEGTKVAAGYPGLKMTEVYEIDNEGTKLYSAAFNMSTYHHFRFVKHNTATSANTNLTAELTGWTAAKPYYTGDTEPWATKPDEALALYYVRGTFGTDYSSWNENRSTLAMTKTGTTQYSLENVTLSAGDELRVYKPSEDKWFGPSNWVITQSGKYSIHIDEAKSDGDGWTAKVVVVNVSYKVGEVFLYDNWDATSGADAEYKNNVSGTAGDTLVINKNGSPITFTAGGEGNGVSADKKFAETATYTIYLKVTGDGASYEVWAAKVEA